MNELYRRLFAIASLCFTSILIACSSIPVPVNPTTAPISPISGVEAKFAYTGNQGGSISGYAVNTSTGALTALTGFPLSVGLNPTALTHDPQNRFLIVADIAADRLHVFAINSATGALTEVSGSPFLTIQEPVSLLVTPNGAQIYVVGMYGNQIGAYTLGSTGTLTPVAGSPFSTGSSGNDAHTIGICILTDAAGKFLYVQDMSNLYTFSISSSGALALLQTITGPEFGDGLALDPAGSYLYAVGGVNSIFTYSIDATSGLLAQSKTSPLAEQNGAYTLSVSPTGKSAYTIENNNYLVSYALNNGVFTHVGSVYSGVYGMQIGIDPSGAFVYVPQACSNCPSGVYNVVNEFAIGDTGALTQVPGSPAPAGVTPWGVTITTQ